MQGLPESRSMSLHLRLRISPLRIPVIGASTRKALSSRSPFSSQTRIISMISSGSGNLSRPGGSFSCGTALTGFLSYFSKRMA